MHDDGMFIIQLSFIDGQIKFSQDIEQRQLAITQILRNIYINSISYLIMRVIITAYCGAYLQSYFENISVFRRWTS